MKDGNLVIFQVISKSGCDNKVAGSVFPLRVFSFDQFNKCLKCL